MILKVRTKNQGEYLNFLKDEISKEKGIKRAFNDFIETIQDRVRQDM